MTKVWLLYILILILVSLVAIFEPGNHDLYGGDNALPTVLDNGSDVKDENNKEYVKPKCITPRCIWKCEPHPDVPQICKPSACVPKCSVKCDDLPLACCKLICQKPECRVVCPETAERCEENPCRLECKPPVCRVECQKPTPKCRVECEPLEHTWQCRKPRNPGPKCGWECDSA